MSFSCVPARRVVVTLVATLLGVSVVATSATEAEARRRKQPRRAHVAAQAYAPPYAAMVVDANTGKVMHAVNEDEIRHPASVTKVMTLYLLFEQLERGALKLDSELDVSRHAASMSPSKLGLRPGETISVEDAIQALVTRSANDVAAAIAENIAGSEDAFAERMTRKARQLGMSRTVYRNASGLPDRGQVTTARDLTILARAVQERFPRYYRYFAVRSFDYEGQRIGNHNKLLGRVEGVDGIKTGFTNASGFNLMTSARLDGRHVVGVVLGGRSGASRDAIMTNLIRTHLARASATGRSSVLAEAPGERVQPAVRPRPGADVETTAATSEAPPRKPLDLNAYRAASGEAAAARAVSAGAAAAAEPPRTIVAAAPPVVAGKIDGRLPAAPAIPLPPPSPARVEATVSLAPPAPPVRPAPEPARPPVAAAPKAAASPWVIQIAAEENEEKALDVLEQARSRTGRLLARAEPFTEKVVRGGSTLFRARFSGFQEADSAQEACKALKSRGFACFATRS